MGRGSSETVNVAVTAVLGNGHLELRETFQVAADFDGLLGILTRFRELAERIRDEQAGLKKG